jgi:hypothetical protein
MKPTHENRALIAALTVGDPVIMNATYTRFRARRLHIIKPKLRSQNVLFALKSMPFIVSRLS